MREVGFCGKECDWTKVAVSLAFLAMAGVLHIVMYRHVEVLLPAFLLTAGLMTFHCVMIVHELNKIVFPEFPGVVRFVWFAMFFELVFVLGALAIILCDVFWFFGLMIGFVPTKLDVFDQMVAVSVPLLVSVASGAAVLVTWGMCFKKARMKSGLR